MLSVSTGGNLHLKDLPADKFYFCKEPNINLMIDKKKKEKQRFLLYLLCVRARVALMYVSVIWE